MQDLHDGSESAAHKNSLSWSSESQVKTPTPVVVPPVYVPLYTPSTVSAPAQSSNSVKYIGIVVIGVLAGIVLAWGWVTMKNSTPAVKVTADSLGVSTDTVPALAANNGLVIMSPQPAGRSVTVSRAQVSVPTWIVIYENKAGKPGNALGAALFFPEGKSGTVELLRSTVSGKSYLAVRQVDNGNKRFSLKDDMLVTENGEVQWVTFDAR